jgi:acetolactate synthase-1/2/3 large subunit
MSQMTGARFLADSFEGYGVGAVFFVPTIFHHTLREMETGTGIKRIVCHDEKSAAYMADGYARVSRRPGVCMAQMIGSLNLAAGLRDAYMSCSPVIAISGGPYTTTRSRNTYQQVEDESSFKPVTKFDAVVDTAERLPDLFRQAFREATTGKPRPVHLQVAGHIGEIELGEADFEVIVEEQFASVPAFRPEPATKAVLETLRTLAAAERPLIVAGGGVRWSDAAEELVAFAELLSIPVVTSLNAKDVIPGNHPLSVGVAGTYSRQSANHVVAEADLVFFIGSATGSQLTLSWNLPRPGTPVIQLDIDPAELGRNYPNRVSLLGDAKAGLRSLIAALDVSSAPRTPWIDRVQGLVRDWRSEFEPLLSSDAIPLRPERLCSELTRLLPSDAVLLSDTGHAGMWTGGMIDLNDPTHSYLRCGGSLGWAFPAALGAKVGAPDRPVVAWIGDGGFWYHIGELETAVRWGINAVIVVNNNSFLNQGNALYADLYGISIDELVARRNERGGVSDLIAFTEVDFARIAEHMGATGIRVENARDIEGALARALESDGPVVIDVVTDPAATAPLAFIPPEVSLASLGGYAILAETAEA